VKQYLMRSSDAVQKYRESRYLTSKEISNNFSQTHFTARVTPLFVLVECCHTCVFTFRVINMFSTQLWR